MNSAALVKEVAKMLLHGKIKACGYFTSNWPLVRIFLANTAQGPQTPALDFLKLTTYLVFFIIIMTFYGIPLNILRDVYVTGRSLITRLRSLHRYQTATRNMDQRYPNATEEEMAAMSDHTCIICREEMVLPRPVEDPAVPANTDGPNTTPKKLPCGHIFHFNCLRSWLERQQSCPTW
jgi:E3 ubiquitin-protein ligase synoviolin